LRPDRKWIFGSNDTIYYYEHLDTYSNEFFNLSVFRFDPKTFEIRDRIFARGAHWEGSLDKWVLENGWERQFEGQVVTEYNPIEASTFAWVNDPPTYFNKEEKQSSEMNYVELKHYIQDLQQSGFDVVRLKVQLHKKFAFPMVALVMALLAIPFSLSAGRRGALTGVGVALGLAVAYWMTSGLFEALGNVSQLPAALAAWAPDVLFGLVGGYLIFKVPT